MATTAQQHAFIKFWTPYAKQAGSALGVPWQWVLSQWAFESGWQLNTPGQYNPGNIETLGSRVSAPQFENFSNPSQFVQQYVHVFSFDFPAYSTLNTGQSKMLSIAELLGKNQTYDPTNPGYGTQVAGMIGTLRRLGVPSPTSANITKKLNMGAYTEIAQATKAASNATNSVLAGPSGWFSFLTPLLGTIGAVVGGLVLIVIGLWLMVRKDNNTEIIPIIEKAAVS